MFIFTAKLSKRKLAAAVVATGVLLCAIILLLSLGGGSADAASSSSSASNGKPSAKKIETNEDRVRFLNGYQWQVDEKPLEFEEVLIPVEFDEVLTEYNNMQKAQGFDLSKYKGKRVMRYAYGITNYPNVSENVRATIFIYKNTVIGGDVHSATMDGFMHGLTKP